MSSAAPARRAALAVLVEARERGAYARELLNTHPAVRGLDARDRALATRLVLGATAAEGVLDTLLDRHLAKPKKVSARVRAALRLATFELLYLGTPASAAVSQGVELVRGQARSAAGLANAVLRRVAEGRAAFLAAEDVPVARRELAAQARQAGLPRWLVERIAREGEKLCADMCACELEPAPVFLHANACRLSDEDAIAAGRADGLALERTALPGCYRVGRPAGVAASSLLRARNAAVSDFSAQAVAAAGVAPGSLLEVGAGRGTKTYVTSSLACRLGLCARRHVAVELAAAKARLNEERLRDAGMPRVDCVTADGRELLSSSGVAQADGTSLADACAAGFDTVLLDAPCSGTGTMRRHPEIPWRLATVDVDPANPNGLPALQAALLAEAARCVGAGGALLYATCSVLSAENEAVVEAFLASAAGRGFRAEAVSSAWAFAQPGFEDMRAWVRAHETPEGFLRTAPVADGPDGHFCARLVRA